MKDGLLQKIASEMNLSETAYVQCLSENGSFEKDDTFSLRWFTPTREVPLCGHATLASAATLFFCAGNTNCTLTFQSLSGPLLARRTGDSGITLDFPLNPAQPHDKDAVKTILQEICGLEHVSDVQYSRTTRKLLVRLKDELTRDFLEGLAPDPRALQASDISGDVMGVIVTLKGHPDEHGYDFLSRYFAPWNGIPEDPVTGSAHTVLADYWSKQLGKTSFKARQCSQRGGDLEVNIAGNRVELTGNARVVLKGTLSNVDLDC